MVRAMVHSTKHYVQTSLNTVVAGAVSSVVLVSSVAVGSKNNATEVEEGNSVKACYIEHWVRTGDTAPGSVIFCLYKLPGTGVAFTASQLASMHDSENKKNVLFFSQGLSNDQDADAIAVMRGWYKIPKSKQRFGLGDQLILATFAQALDQITCGFATYKEYS